MWIGFLGILHVIWIFEEEVSRILFPACCCIGFGSGIRCTIGLIASILIGNYPSNCCVCDDKSIVTPPWYFLHHLTACDSVVDGLLWI